MAYTPPDASAANFSFTDIGYTPSSTTFDFTPADYYQIWTDATYVYAALSTGLKIYEIESESEYAYINYTVGFNTVWGNDTRVFVGTFDAGIKYLNKTCISGSIVTPVDLIGCLNNFSDLTYYSTLTSPSIVYLHGYGDVIGVVTTSGVDIIKIDPQSYRSFTTISGVRKCFMAAEKFYYTLYDRVNRVDNILGDWTTPSTSYVTGSGIFEAGIEINDIYIFDGVLYTATTSGVYVIDEVTEEYTIYYIE